MEEKGRWVPLEKESYLENLLTPEYPEDEDAFDQKVSADNPISYESKQSQSNNPLKANINNYRNNNLNLTGQHLVAFGSVINFHDCSLHLNISREESSD